MTEPHVVTLIVAVIGPATALTVGHLHRKQMRQLELFRADPAVGLVPPPNPVVKFFKTYSTRVWYVFNVCWGAWGLLSARTFEAQLSNRPSGAPVRRYSSAIRENSPPRRGHNA
jgi:hypothetical protein